MTMESGLKAVFFDLDGTLLFPDAQKVAETDAKIVNTIQSLGCDVYFQEFSEIREFIHRTQCRVGAITDNSTFTNKILSELDVQIPSNVVTTRIEPLFESYAEAYGLYEDVMPALSTLKNEGVYIGLTCGASPNVEKKIGRFNLRNVFDIITYFSSLTRSRKIDTGLLLETCRNLGVKASETAYVSGMPDENFRTELDALKLSHVFLRRLPYEFLHEKSPSIRVQNLYELINWMEKEKTSMAVA